ncbi:hypothetical protein M8C21_015118, partial [Ambrosia artemisiifolia]
MKQPSTGSGLSIPVIPSHHQQQQNHTIVPISPTTVPPPVPQLPNLPRTDLLEGSRENYIKVGVPLYEAAMKGNWKAAKPILDKQPDLIRFAITDNCETLLHIAATAERTKSVEEFLVNLITLMEIEDLELQNRNNNTALSLAAATGNVEAARMMVEKNQNLMEMVDGNGMMPLNLAALFAEVDTMTYLYNASKKMSGDCWSKENQGWVLQKCVEDLAIQIVKDHPQLMDDKEIATDVLFALARKPRAF